MTKEAERAPDGAGRRGDLRPRTRLEDARRLTGPNLYGPAPAVLVELLLDPADDTDAVVAAYHAQWSRLLGAVGLEAPPAEALQVRRYRGGVAIACAGPIDTLLAATEAAEWAALAAAELLAGRPAQTADSVILHKSIPATQSPTLPPSSDSTEFVVSAESIFQSKCAEIGAMLAAQRSPALLEVADEAQRRGLPLLWDDERVSVGTGRRSRTYDRACVPAAAQVPWAELGALPFAFVTGTNGKTTSARLIARMVREGGRVPACTSSDGVAVDEVFVEGGDCTGPFAARSALLRPDVEVAVLETARGGILRRGLALGGAEAALITNVSDDHLGTYGIDDVPAMARVKAVVGHAVKSGGRVVLSADDAGLVTLAPTFAAEVVYFSLDPASAVIGAHLTRGGEAWLDEDGTLVRRHGGERAAIIACADIPIAYGGAARFNVANALGAAATAHALGVEDAAIARALRGFTPSHLDNPGRGNLFDVHGVRVLLDFAHNAEAVRAVLQLATSLRGEGALTVVTGSAGDRSDAAIRELAAVVFAAHPTRVYLRELEHYLRGRASGEVTALFRASFLRLGLPAENIVQVPSEVAALEAALASARPGDFLLFLVHIERDEMRGALALHGAVER